MGQYANQNNLDDVDLDQEISLPVSDQEPSLGDLADLENSIADDSLEFEIDPDDDSFEIDLGE